MATSSRSPFIQKAVMSLVVILRVSIQECYESSLIVIDPALGGRLHQRTSSRRDDEKSVHTQVEVEPERISLVSSSYALLSFADSVGSGEETVDKRRVSPGSGISTVGRKGAGVCPSPPHAYPSGWGAGQGTVRM
jgi:hypothetical protein